MQFYLYYKKLINEIKNDNQQLILVTIPPCNSTSRECSNDNQDNVTLKNNVIRKLSYEYNTCYVDIFNNVFKGSFNVSQISDGVHPNTASHQLINQSIYEGINNCQSFNCSLHPENCSNYIPKINLKSKLSFFGNIIKLFN
jgi:lysophospholipase L1-like esterase